MYSTESNESEKRVRRTAGRKKSNPGSYVAYIRVSDKKQEISGLGLEAQRAAVARYLAQVKGNLISEHIEVESGKKHTNRPQLLAAISAAKALGATLVIAKLDRLARNVHFISGLMESAADFVACDMPAANKLTLHVMAAMAEHEREMIAKRTLEGLKVVKGELQRNGFRVSPKSGRRFTKLGNPRWAESIERARAARHKAVMQSQVLQVIQARRAAADSLRVIAQALNEMGLKTPTGAQWHASSVRTALHTAA